jgi:hypothetical protein
MSLNMMEALRKGMGCPLAPETITQQALDFDATHLHRLVRLTPGERAKPGDLWDYAQDLLYTEIQQPLLAYLLPVCLHDLPPLNRHT